MRHNAGHSNTSPNYYCASNLHNKRPEVPVELVYVALLGLSSSSPQLGAQCCFVYLFYFMTFDTEIRLPEKRQTFLDRPNNHSKCFNFHIQYYFYRSPYHKHTVTCHTEHFCIVNVNFPTIFTPDMIIIKKNRSISKQIC